MTDKQKKYAKEALEVIKKHKIALIDHVWGFTSFSKATAYNHGLDKNKEILNLLNEHTYKQKQHKITAKQKNKRQGTGYVYVIKCGNFDLYKIGISKDTPKNRLSGIQVGSPFPLTMTHIIYCDYFSYVEKLIHSKYSKYRVLGEWFELNEKTLKNVVADINNYSTKQIKLF